MIRWQHDNTIYRLEVSKVDSYEIILRQGGLEQLGSLLFPCLQEIESRSCIIVTDTNVRKYCLPVVHNSLQNAAIRYDTIVIPSGEKSKSLRTAFRLWEQLQQLKAERRTLLVALGGGVICDLVGFVAASYMRGLPYVNVPTSLMAQVDGAIGGKVGVDHPTAKNLIGAFYHPTSVIIDPFALRSLASREYINGLAEVVKVAIIASEPLFDTLSALDVAAPLHAQDLESLTAIIQAAVSIKLRLLEHDPFERSLDRLLNFGHEIGHALEAATKYRTYRHGEAVAIGMALATKISLHGGGCSQHTHDRIFQLLLRLGLPTTLPKALHEPVWSHLSTITRIRNGKLRLVIPLDIGQCSILESISFEQYCATVETLSLA